MKAKHWKTVRHIKGKLDINVIEMFCIFNIS